MINKATAALTEAMVKRNVITSEKRDTYIHCNYMLLFSALTWGSLLILGCIIASLAQTLVFIAFYLPLRICAGGYHASSPQRCYVLSMAVFCLLFLVANSIMPPLPILLIVLCLAGGIIFFNAPVDHANHRLTEKQIASCKKMSRIIVAVESIIILVLLLLKWDIALFGLSALLLEMLLLIAARVTVD